MKKFKVLLAFLLGLIAGCDNAETKAKKKEAHLASLTCDSTKEGRTAEELQAIGDACFKKGGYTKSSGIKW